MEEDTESRILGTIYGNCIGDAIGLLTEFMPKKTAEQCYKAHVQRSGLEYDQKVPDMHRQRWICGDWTDDSDQMILILDSILEENGEVTAAAYAKKLYEWVHYGFTELGDKAGMGIGATTYKVVSHRSFQRDPHTSSLAVWEASNRTVAPNGAVMRTSILGVYQFESLLDVQKNALEICKVTHADPRCQASCIAVVTAISCMLRKEFLDKGKFDVKKLTDFALKEAEKAFQGHPDEKALCKELADHMTVKKLKQLKLDDHDSIGYTYKTLGAGFWALRQDNFRHAITELVMEGGDADTNAAVAGALLGCKLGHGCFPNSWLYDLANLDWLNWRIRRFMEFAFPKLKLTILPSTKIPDHLEDQILGTLYGHCIADAVGLLTEFMTKQQAAQTYTAKNEKGELELSYEQKFKDKHRSHWYDADWTDDSDQMILIMDSIVACNGNVDPLDYGHKLRHWASKGFPELGDMFGAGLGNTTNCVLKHDKFMEDPHFAAHDIWEKTGCEVAPNGGVMRTSVLGIYQYTTIPRVKKNTVAITKVTHADQRCSASSIAVTCAIAFMMNRSHVYFKNGEYDVNQITEDAYNEACTIFPIKDKKSMKELEKYMFVTNLADLKLDDKNSLGYTYKALGAGFWALRQNSFKQAITELVMEGGDADTNGVVAGALLGCKLGYAKLVEEVPTWLFQLRHKNWLDQKIRRFLTLAFPDLKLTKLEEPTDQTRLQMEELDKVAKFNV